MPNHAYLRQQAETYANQLINNLNLHDRGVLTHQVCSSLMHEHQCSRATAGILAATAVASIESAECPARVDISHSTSDCIFIHYQGQLRALSAVDLARVLDTEHA